MPLKNTKVVKTDADDSTDADALSSASEADVAEREGESLPDDQATDLTATLARLDVSECGAQGDDTAQHSTASDESQAKQACPLARVDGGKCPVTSTHAHTRARISGACAHVYMLACADVL